IHPRPWRAHRAGSADLPLHGGRVPAWLGQRMSRLGAVISQAIVYHYGRDELLRRLAHPFWFQSFGAVMGMDWHSSGITTSVIGALKRGLAPLERELGLHVCGGRGKHSRKTPQELVAIGERVGFDGAALATASRLVAKVDSAAVQDGFDLYLHGFIVADDGAWVVVQQGMNGARRQARRYHWIWDRAGAFIEEPHAAIEGRPVGDIVNLVDRRAADGRGAPSRFADPARFSLAHGGKDGHPFPVPLKVYDETIGVLRRAVERAKLGQGDRLAAIKRLDDQARRLDAVALTPAEFDRAV